MIEIPTGNLNATDAICSLCRKCQRWV